MKIMVFTEGTALMFQSGKDLSREERVKLSQSAGVQQEESTLAFNSVSQSSKVEPGSVYDFAGYLPAGHTVDKLNSWKKQGAQICYLTSRRIKSEIETIWAILEKYNFPDWKNLFFRRQGEDYKDVAERVRPDVLIEDDCESIGGEAEMTYPHIREDLKPKIKSIVVKEFQGIDHLPDSLEALSRL